MNDRLKFRAWDKKIKKFIDISGLKISNFSDYPRQFIVEQSTGLKDKNGKPIFEGDILQRMVQPYNQMGYKENYEVKELGYYLPQGETYGIFCVNLWGTDCEVIGNIHENPELLEAK